MAPSSRPVDAFPFGGRTSGSGSGSGRRPGPFDGPGSHPGSADRSGRPTSRGPSSRTTSTTRAAAPANSGKVVAIKSLSWVGLGAHAQAYSNEYEEPYPLVKRPGYSNLGKGIHVNINAFKVLSVPSIVVHQFDILIGNGAEKRGLIMAVWNSKQVQSKLGGFWIFDGNRLAWSGKPQEALTLHVNMDTEKGRPDTGKNIHRFQIRKAKTMDLYPLQAYLTSQGPFETPVVEAINFIEHLMRTGPSEYLLSIKQSFFDKATRDREVLSHGLLAIKGVYQSLKLANGGHMIVNADVSNSVFWNHEQTLLTTLCDMNISGNPRTLIQDMQPIRVPGRDPQESVVTRNAKRLAKLQIKVRYARAPEAVTSKTYVVKRIIPTDAIDYKFDQTNRSTGQTRSITIQDYFMSQYSVDINHPYAPLVETMKGNMYPLEFCYPVEGQRYPFKLSEISTSEMIKFAVTKPDVRANAVMGGVRALNWSGDKYLQKYKMSIDTKMIKTQARLLQPPEVEFGKGRVEKPGTAGRWRIDGKQFAQPNPKPLKHWGVMIMNNFGRGPVAPKAQVQQFMSSMITEYQKFGGVVVAKQPIIMESNPDIAKSTELLFGAIKKNCAADENPQLLVFIVNGKTTDAYNRLKKNCDCRFGVVSQVMQAAHVKKMQLQYMGNVLMKVNAKLGGFSFKALPAGQKPNSGYTHFKTPTMIIGADVSHPGPGALGASMAAMSVSMDKYGIRYAASCESNGHRIEMIAPWNWEDMLKPLFLEWMKSFNGMLPKHIIYMRDGVSEGQYQHVLHRELRDLRAVWETIPRLNPAHVEAIKYTVIVCSKRHHVRFFPADGNKDQNNNPLPGTLVEKDITSVHDWDFYLCAHRAIQGTARPVHYAILVDEQKCPADYLIRLIYEQSYQYVRSSTPVSVHPAIYYAHLAARRAVAHERDPHGSGRGGTHKPSEEKEKADLEDATRLAYVTGKRMTKTAIQRLRELNEMAHPRLIPLNPETQVINKAMWYV